MDCNCNNCNGGYGGNYVTDFSIESGDTFPIYLTYKDGAVTGFPTGTDVTVGFYGALGNLLASATTEDGTLRREGEALVLDVPHSMSEAMAGIVEMEITLHTSDESEVDHADRVIRINFTPRRNNTIL